MMDMMNNVEKVNVFNDMIAHLEENNNINVGNNIINDMKNYYTDKETYQENVKLLSEKLEGLKPLDNLVNSVVYVDNFTEKGIAIKSHIMSFKKLWNEYCVHLKKDNVNVEENLVLKPNNMELYIPKVENNFKSLEPEIEEKEEKKDDKLVDLDNFNFGLNPMAKEENKEELDKKVVVDENYKKLYSKVINLSKYIEEFNKKKIDLDRQIFNLEQKQNRIANEEAKLNNAKAEFERYKKEEEKKINELRNEVNGKVVSLQNLIDNLDDMLENFN